MTNNGGDQVTALEILKWVGSIVATMIGAYLMYAIRTLFGRIKDLEDEASDQRVKNQSFEDYQLFKDLKDKEFADFLQKISTKIDDLKESFDDKFEELTKSIHRLELRYEGGRSGKR